MKRIIMWGAFLLNNNCSASDLFEREFERLVLEIQEAQAASKAFNAVIFHGEISHDAGHVLIILDCVTEVFHSTLKEDFHEIMHDSTYQQVVTEINRRFQKTTLSDAPFGTLKDVVKSPFLCDVMLSNIFFKWHADDNQIICMKRLKLAAFRKMCEKLTIAPESLKPCVRYEDDDYIVKKYHHRVSKKLCVIL